MTMLRWIVRRWKFGSQGRQMLHDCAVFLEIHGKCMREQRIEARTAYANRELLPHAGKMFDAMKEDIDCVAKKAASIRRAIGARML